MDRPGGRGGHPSRAAGSHGLKVGLVWLLLAGLAGDGATEPAGSATPEFSGRRAMQWLNHQCAMGPRSPGSAGILALRAAIAAHADSLGLRCEAVCFHRDDPYRPGRMEICNLVVSAGPEEGERIWLGAHYDTRPRCDRDPDPTLRDQPLTGANDGASGVAVLLHLAEIMASRAPPQGVDLIFFDAEDYGKEGDLQFYCMGSFHLARHWRDFGSPLAAGTPIGLIVLDMVGQADLRIPMEGYSLAHAERWTRSVFDRAVALGLGAFVPRPGPEIWDDHVPFLREGIPSMDLIDFSFPQWHTTRDVPEVCSAISLAQVGQLITDIVYRPLEPQF